MSIWISNSPIEISGKPYYIADIAANHDGDLSRAFKLIELAKEAGADAAKFQNFVADKIVSKLGFENIEISDHQKLWKKTIYEVYKDVSINADWTRECRQVIYTEMR